MLICVLDTGHANLTSVCRALEEAGKDLPLTILRSHRQEDLTRADKLVFPGQGGFRECMGSLSGGLDELLVERLKGGTPYLGICLGLQALFDSSEEAPGVKGLGLLPGTNARLKNEPSVKIPHMGWNELREDNGGHPLLKRAGGTGAWVYFVHSYHAVPVDPSVIKGSVSYGTQTVTAAVARDNLFATQFHPEKSQDTGLRLLRAFLEA